MNFDFIRNDSNKVSEEKNHLKALNTIRNFNTERQSLQLPDIVITESKDLAKKYFDAEKAYQMTMDFEDLSEFPRG